MRVDVADALKHPGEFFTFKGEAAVPPEDVLSADMGFTIAFPPPVLVEGTFYAEGDTITLEGIVVGRVRTECALCLAPVERPLKAELTETFSRESDEGHMDARLYDGTNIELDEYALAALILELPMRLNCSDQCKGLCPVCGVNLNEETCACERTSQSPFAALKQFVED